MTEEEWQRCTDPTVMLAFLRGKVGERKMRLWVCACCRRVGHLLAEPGRLAVEVAERLADGAAPATEVSATRVAVRTATRQTPAATLGWYALWAAQAAVSARLTGRHPLPGGLAEHAARQCVSATADWALATAPAGGNPLGGAYGSSLRAESARQAALLRCILGSPFGLVTVDLGWLIWNGGAVVKLATAVYEERELPSGHLDPARLAILADMLEEAGATGPQLLGHLRSPGPHVRGCAAVDALLGRS